MTVTACSKPQAVRPMSLLAEKQVPMPSATGYTYCYDHACKSRVTRRLRDRDRAALTALFTPRTPFAEAERHRIAEAVAYMEKVNGEGAGTAGDVGGTFTGMFKGGQLDCEDEAINTTTTLMLLGELGLLTHHAAYGQAHRGNLLNAWPHVSATIREKATGRIFVVDSWFDDNAQPPHVIDHDTWMAGWHPPGWSD